MKAKIIQIIVLILFPMLAIAQTPAKIVLKTGETIMVYDFAQKDCDKSSHFDKYILIKGLYQDNVTEIKDYAKIAKIQLVDFEEEPIKTGGNEKGMINIRKKNGIIVTLEKADISLSCYGVDEQYNQLRVTTLNPLTEEKIETPVNTKDIDYILFE